METTDNSLKEMQQQMQLLKDKLDKQTIVNGQMMRKAVSKGINNLRTKTRAIYLAGLAAIFGAPSFYNLGCSIAFVIFSVVIALLGMAAAAYKNRNIPDMEDDLLTVANKLARFKTVSADWIKIGMPILLVWFGVLLFDMHNRISPDSVEFRVLTSAIVLGVIVGVVSGLKIRRSILTSVDDLIDQINDLQDQH